MVFPRTTVPAGERGVGGHPEYINALDAANSRLATSTTETRRRRPPRRRSSGPNQPNPRGDSPDKRAEELVAGRGDASDAARERPRESAL